MCIDADGEFFHILAGAVVGAVVGAVSSIVSQVVSGEEINWTAVVIEAGAGAVSGAINTACPCLGPVATGFVEGTISAVSYAATEKFAYGRDPSFGEVLSVGISSGVMAGSMKYVSQELGLVQCFVSGTIVSTASCSKNIEDIQVGDKVWATNPETGETELKEVTQLFRGQTDEWVHVFAGEEEIVCTPGHPFYLPENGWINAGDLRVGDVLVTIDGSSIIIERIYREQLDNPEATYNFEVEGFHTYYVSDVELLVHNKWLVWMATCVASKFDFQLKDCTEDLQTLKNAKRIVGLGVKCQLSRKTEDRGFLKSKISDIITAEQTVLGSLLEQLQK